MGSIVGGFNSVRGIIRCVGYLESIGSGCSEGMCGGGIKSNSEFGIMEGEMVRMVKVMRRMVEVEMM